MKSSVRGAVLLVAAVVAVLLVSAAGAAGSRVTTLHLVEKDSSFHFVDNPPRGMKAGPSAGDVFAFAGELLDDLRCAQGTHGFLMQAVDNRSGGAGGCK